MACYSIFDTEVVTAPESTSSHGPSQDALLSASEAESVGRSDVDNALLIFLEECIISSDFLAVVGDTALAVSLGGEGASS